MTQETIDYVAVNRLHHAYADIATRRAWAELDEIFVADIPIVVNLRDRDPLLFDSCEAFRAFVSEAVDRFEFFEFVILNTRVYLNHQGDPDAAVARMYMSELRQDHAEQRWSAIYGVYHDRFRRIDGRWWFVGRDYSSLARPGAQGRRRVRLPVAGAVLIGPHWRFQFTSRMDRRSSRRSDAGAACCALVHPELAEPVCPWPVACLPIRAVTRIALDVISRVVLLVGNARAERGSDAHVLVFVTWIDHEIDTPLPPFPATRAAVDEMLIEDDHITWHRLDDLAAGGGITAETDLGDLHTAIGV